jgi:hypothetical protein
MTKEQKLSLIRHSLSAIGGILIAIGIGNPGLFTELIGLAMSVAGVVFSIIDKTATVSMVSGAARQILTALSGYLSAKFVITPDTIDAIVSIVSVVLATTLGMTDKVETPVTEETTT